MVKLAERVAGLPPYVFAKADRKIAEIKAAGIDVINLGIGSPDMAPPAWIVDRLVETARRDNQHGYGGFYGVPKLRQAVADYYQQRFAVPLDPAREVAMLIGSKEGLFNMALAYLDPGDVCLVPDPGYPTYSLGTHMASGTSYYFPLLAERDFLPDLEAVPTAVLQKTKLLWLNYPNNPTGATADLSALEPAVAFCRRHDILLCFDNPYCDLTFDGYVAPSILQIPGAKDVTVEFNSLSKTYNMAGWRVGYAVGNAEAVAALALTKTNIDSGIFLPIQEAAAAALTGDQSWLAARNMIYQRRRDVVMAFLPSLGMSARCARAAMYVWAQLPPGAPTSLEYSQQVLERTGVWVTPGSAFGQHGEGFVRIALTISEERLIEAGKRLREDAAGTSAGTARGGPRFPGKG